MGRKFIVLEQALTLAAMLAALQILPGALPAAFAGGALPEGRKTITLVSTAGDKQVIGHVTFSKDGDGAAFDLKLNAP